jgi:agmatine deiminase
MQAGSMACAGAYLGSCSEDADRSSTDTGHSSDDGGRSSPVTTVAWVMPAEDVNHERTWMCWPSNESIWGDMLSDVQSAIANLAGVVAEFEPVTMLARPAERRALASRLPGGVELLDAPVDDLWARDTLPNFVVRTPIDGVSELAAGHATFNGWGVKQVHDGDTQLARLVADHLEIELTESGLTGEGGGIEVDGAGTVLAASSCWVNPNRNPGRTREQVEAALLMMLGADRMIWVDGLAGLDITDGHIDTLARFAGETVIVVEKPAFDDPADPWAAVATRTRQLVMQARTRGGKPYEVVEIIQPTETRGKGAEFLATYMNFYLCNGAVIAPEFGDRRADSAATDVLARLFPSREIVMLNIDPIAAGGGGIHCATQQQPMVTSV